MNVGIIGPGRAGVGLALALRKSGVPVLGLHGRRRKRLPAGLALSVGGEPPWLRDADVVLLAVRDDALTPLVRQLARAKSLRKGQVYLHLCGALPAAVLAPLAKRGAAIGAMHPLMTVSSDPRQAGERFRDATFALEGRGTALASARRLVRELHGIPVVIRPAARARYHAGAVFASNYVTVALVTAESLLAQAGFTRAAARRALAPLAQASLDNVARLGPARALTGPIARGDTTTVRRHLAAMDRQTRALYRALALGAVELALQGGLPKSRASALRRVLR
jgi:predicted short-subunit dehydrogenase-like oxidoreductase (DUF2520 family)